jgi:hypothetical protein
MQPANKLKKHEGRHDIILSKCSTVLLVLLPPSSPQPCLFSYIQPSAKNKYIWVGHMTNFNSKLNFQREREKKKERKKTKYDTITHTEKRKKNKRQPRARDAERTNRKKETNFTGAFGKCVWYRGKSCPNDNQSFGSCK